MATTTQRMNFAEFEKLDWSPDERYELRHGDPVKLPPLRLGHALIQENLRALLKQAAGDAGLVLVELGFRIGDRNYRVSDVAYFSRERLGAQDPRRPFYGAPDMVIEILSPSNTAADVRDRRKLCLENGSAEFWVVDAGLREVEVSTPDGRSITYTSGQEIPLLFGGRAAVDAIFA